MDPLPVFFISGHSDINKSTSNHVIEPVEGQYIIMQARCGMPNYVEQKKLYNYLRSPSDIQRLRNGLKRDPNKFVEKLTKNRLATEKSEYQVHYHGGPPLFDQQIDILTENYNGIRLIPNEGVTVGWEFTPLENRNNITIERVEYAQGSDRAAEYRASPKNTLKDVWISDLIGDKPGIYIIATCRGHLNIGTIVNESFNHPPATSIFAHRPAATWTITTTKKKLRKLNASGKPFNPKTPINKKIYKRTRTYKVVPGSRPRPVNSNQTMGSETEEGFINLMGQRVAQGDISSRLMNAASQEREYRYLLRKMPQEIRRLTQRFIKKTGVTGVIDKLTVLKRIVKRS